MSNPASLGDVQLPWALRTGNKPGSSGGISTDQQMVDLLNLIALRIAPQPRSQKVVCDLAPNGFLTVDLGGQVYNNILATVLTGNVAVYFGGSVGSSIDVQFAAGNPSQAFFPALQNTQITFKNPDTMNAAYAVIWLINY